MALAGAVLAAATAWPVLADQKPAGPGPGTEDAPVRPEVVASGRVLSPQGVAWATWELFPMRYSRAPGFPYWFRIAWQGAETCTLTDCIPEAQDQLGVRLTFREFLIPGRPYQAHRSQWKEIFRGTARLAGVDLRVAARMSLGYQRVVRLDPAGDPLFKRVDAREGQPGGYTLLVDTVRR